MSCTTNSNEFTQMCSSVVSRSSWEIWSSDFPSFCRWYLRSKWSVKNSNCHSYAFACFCSGMFCKREAFLLSSQLLIASFRWLLCRPCPIKDISASSSTGSPDFRYPSIHWCFGTHIRVKWVLAMVIGHIYICIAVMYRSYKPKWSGSSNKIVA